MSEQQDAAWHRRLLEQVNRCPEIQDIVQELRHFADIEAVRDPDMRVPPVTIFFGVLTDAATSDEWQRDKRKAIDAVWRKAFGYSIEIPKASA
jgi:hypothetical protein